MKGVGKSMNRKKQTIALNKTDVALIIRGRARKVEFHIPKLQDDEPVTNDMITMVTLGAMLSAGDEGLHKLMQKKWEEISNKVK